MYHRQKESLLPSAGWSNGQYSSSSAHKSLSKAFVCSMAWMGLSMCLVACGYLYCATTQQKVELRCGPDSCVVVKRFGRTEALEDTLQRAQLVRSEIVRVDTDGQVVDTSGMRRKDLNSLGYSYAVIYSDMAFNRAEGEGEGAPAAAAEQLDKPLREPVAEGAAAGSEPQVEGKAAEGGEGGGEAEAPQGEPADAGTQQEKAAEAQQQQEKQPEEQPAAPAEHQVPPAVEQEAALAAEQKEGEEQQRKAEQQAEQPSAADAAAAGEAAPAGADAPAADAAAVAAPADDKPSQEPAVAAPAEAAAQAEAAAAEPAAEQAPPEQPTAADPAAGGDSERAALMAEIAALKAKLEQHGQQQQQGGGAQQPAADAAAAAQQAEVVPAARRLMVSREQVAKLKQSLESITGDQVERFNAIKDAATAARARLSSLGYAAAAEDASIGRGQRRLLVAAWDLGSNRARVGQRSVERYLLRSEGFVNTLELEEARFWRGTGILLVAGGLLSALVCALVGRFREPYKKSGKRH